ncbi:MAG: hypothetical protein H0W94_04700 [Actinobacteria bacterium]|nr:hypothetical protein [Actinomycetota bacterium]
MSQRPSLNTSAVRPERKEMARRGRLMVVPAPRERVGAGIWFFLLAFVLTASLVTAVVVLQALVSQGSFGVQELARLTTRLERDNGELRREVAELSAPSRIVEEARRFGLQPPQEVEIVFVEGRGRGGDGGAASGGEGSDR